MFSFPDTSTSAEESLVQITQISVTIYSNLHYNLLKLRCKGTAIYIDMQVFIYFPYKIIALRVHGLTIYSLSRSGYNDCRSLWSLAKWLDGVRVSSFIYNRLDTSIIKEW